MIRFLLLQIKLGKITIDDVPSKYVDEVRKELNL